MSANREFGPFLTTREAQAYIPCRTRNAVYDWCKRHGIVRRSNGSIAKADLDRVLNRKRTKRVMHPASLANLRSRRASVQPLRQGHEFPRAGESGFVSLESRVSLGQRGHDAIGDVHGR